ncbi:PspC domain-containing protein [Prevotella sp. P6B4]|uniref:PspC domain-containing protein n=1 Tax=Prevotella sp. P6B4 TaxID=1410614 RepID=UPI00048C364C|nr:PspC domain-containing protein [Prevotella sp. P6B4]
MKKNITINLCGRLFQIDEDAYELLQQYINSLRSSFGKQEGGDEIVDDIENRIAELFDELRQQGIEAITIEHVKEIITRIGKPEELTGEEGKEGEQQHDSNGTNWEEKARSAGQKIYEDVRARTAGKKLYRNPKDKMLAGVMSGIAVYTNTDPVIWRFLMILFTLCYGVGIFIYLVLALVIPEARTPEQLLQMEGKDVTPQNLADVVVEGKNQRVQHPSFLRLLFIILMKVVIAFAVIVSLVVCIALTFGFFGVLIATVSAMVLPLNSTLPFSLGAMGLEGAWVSNPKLLIIFVIALFLVLLIPIYAIIHMVLSLTGKIRPMGVVQRIVNIVLWVIAVCIAVPLGISIANYHYDYYQERYQIDYTTTYQGVKMNEDDADFLRSGSWNLIKAENCDHYTYYGMDGQGYDNARFMDVFNDNCEEVFQAERKEKVEPGIYQLTCYARAEGPGTFIYAMGKEKHLQSIPVNENSEDEMGWKPITIDSIVVAGDSVAYGMSSDKAFTGEPCRAKWFSAMDFELTRTGDLPKGKK